MQPLGQLAGHAVEIRHLAKRFFESLSRRPPTAGEDRWVRSHLNDGEVLLWEQMSAPDQRHALHVAREVATREPGASRAVMAAAVLHDVGKVVSGYGTLRRVGATVAWALIPGAARGRLAHRWGAGEGLGRARSVRRLARYRLHPELGAELLRNAGADELTASWAAQHHSPEERWSIDPAIGRMLKACDND